MTSATTSFFPFSMAVEDVVVRNGRRMFVPAGETPNSVAASAVFSQRSGYVEPFSQRTVQVLLTVPDGTKVRGVVILFRGRHVATQSGVTLNASLGSLVTFTLSGDAALAAEPVRVRAGTASENLQIADALANVGTEPVVVSP